MIIYSIIETAKENNLNPYNYLTYLFERLQNIDLKDKDMNETKLRLLLSDGAFNFGSMWSVFDAYVCLKC